jgi:acetylornithine deacetylase/succinyl-diaminopimelate desuccinylase-like protein
MDVGAPGPGWPVPPFSGLVRGGALWGRGAIDCKSLGIAQLAALIDLQRKRVALERDVIFLAVADEENGGGRGTAWLLAAHPELFKGVEGVYNEGGKSQTGAGGKLLWWGIETAQKRPLWLAVSSSGRGGHASGLNVESASHLLVQGLARLLALPPKWRVSAPVRTYLRAIAPLQNAHWKKAFLNIDTAIAVTGPKEFLMPGMANLFLDTVQVTVVQVGERINVIPDRASARIDIRLLPDTDSARFLAEVKKALGPDLQVEVLATAPPSSPSPTSGRAYEALEKGLRGEGPVVPTFIPGFTDSRYFRERGIPAYGIAPFRLAPEESRGIHATDERISLAELERGVARMRKVVRAYAAPAAR